ncbi:MAG: hypothetical protein ABIQ72_05475 [Usitatibacter sp.]
MKKLLAIGLTACLIPTGLAAEDPAKSEWSIGSENILVIEDSAPITNDLLCARSAADKASTDCMAVQRAVLTARMQRVSLRERGRWM